METPEENKPTEPLQSPPKSSETNLTMVAAGIYQPKLNPNNPPGDDAFFICSKQKSLGIADGVGGWATKGINAGEYARQLMQNAMSSVLHQPNGSVDPRTVLNEAFHKTKVRGSSTACIATVKKSTHNYINYHILHAVNVGDSGFMIFRNRKLIVRSPVQQHRFNKPYQLGDSNDTPESAMEFRIGVEDGDILVFGTDGVFDNLFSEEIESIVGYFMGGVGPEELARVIARVALHNSVDRWRRSPFSEAARMAGKVHAGGKIDDITVIVAYMDQDPLLLGLACCW